MVICWDNIKNLYLVKSKKYLKDRKTGSKYIEKGPCKNCNNMFLGQPKSTSNFCSKSCASTGNNNNKWKGGYRKKGIPRYDLYKNRLKKYENIRHSFIDENILEVACCECGKYFIPKEWQVFERIKWIETGKGNENKFYCSSLCKENSISFGMKKYSKLISEEKNKERMREYNKNNREYLRKYEEHYNNSYCLWDSVKRENLEKYYGLIKNENIVGIECKKCNDIFYPFVKTINLKLDNIREYKKIPDFLCKKCDKLIYKNRSHLEDYIYDIIKEKTNQKYNIIKNDRNTILNPYTNHYLELDIYCPELKWAIEISGKRWHDKEEVKKRDLIKKQECKKIGIDLLVIWYEDFKENKEKTLNKLDMFLDIMKCGN